MDTEISSSFVKGFAQACFDCGLHEKQASAMLELYIQGKNEEMHKEAAMTGGLVGGLGGALLGGAAGAIADVDPARSAALASIPSAVLGALIGGNRSAARKSAVDTLDRMQNPDKYKALGYGAAGSSIDPALRNAGMARLVGLGGGPAAVGAVLGANKERNREEAKDVVLGNSEPNVLLDNGGILGALGYGGAAALAGAGLGTLATKGESSALPAVLAAMAGVPAALYGGLKADARSVARKVVKERSESKGKDKDKD